MKRRLLGLMAAALISFSAHAFEPFVVRDIRVEGIQRIEAGTVFSYLPLKVGDTVTQERASAAIKALYGTGFFKDVRLERDGDVLVVFVEERPAISQIDFIGVREFDLEQLRAALKQVGLAEARIFDRALLERAEQELKRQYLSRGKYGVQVSTTVTPLDRNRVAITFTVDEGEVAKIRQINIVGNRAFSESQLLGLFQLTTPGWITWYTKNDQYSRQKLSADLETLRSFYLDQGYLEFGIDSTQVSITPDKRDIYITIAITEGSRYTVSDVKLEGDLRIPEEELRKLVKIKPGEVFSRAKVTESSKLITDRLGDEGYAFANVNAVPQMDKDKKEVAFTFFVDPGRRVYVRRISIQGNTRTRDEVIRRELRQLEGAWYSARRIEESKKRLDRLGYFKQVNVETPAVPGTTDQVDVVFTVEEQPTGALLLGAGFSSSEGLVLSGSISQNNFLGTGNALSLQVNSGKVNTVYALSFTQPYWTVDGVSRGFDIFKRDVDSTSLDVGSYKTSTLGLNFRLGVPVTADDTILFGLGAENTEVSVFADSPQRFVDFVNTFGESNTNFPFTVAWQRDTRDSAFFPRSGRFQRAGAEVSLPVGDLQYYKLSYQQQWFMPLGRTWSLLLRGEVGYGDGYNDKPLPFYKNFFAGGINTVRGFETGSLGPRDVNDEALGGNRMVVGSAEVFFPFPGFRDDKTARMSVFLDAGAVYGDEAKAGSEGVRFSTGVSVSWLSPVGPLRLSLGFPLNAKDTDKKEPFQFQLGRTF
ncbi:outer membrane protein assembly factor BamA [Pelomicrobium sp. G1]|uniref:outer membrane protein assembly factor BamA n=1 Tax=unclassified Pelomicrobium TaxID=2815318 RepID=UPI003F775672